MWRHPVRRCTRGGLVLVFTRGDLVVAGSGVHTRGPRVGVLPHSGGLVCPLQGADGRL